MHALDANGARGHEAVGRPDMTILEAADAMERVHGTRLQIRQGERFLGVLTEEDIVHKVLEAGRRPEIVRVADIMRGGWERRDGTLLLEDDAAPPILDEEARVARVLQGKCEECGSLEVDLCEADGLVLCTGCYEGAAGAS